MTPAADEHGQDQLSRSGLLDSCCLAEEEPDVGAPGVIVLTGVLDLEEKLDRYRGRRVGGAHVKGAVVDLADVAQVYAERLLC